MEYLDEERARIEYQRARYALVTDDAAELAADYLAAKDPEGAEHYGPPDTSLNPISAATRQLTTPGLYGVTPSVTVTGSQEVIEALDAARYWQRGRWAQFLTVGVGIAFRRLSLVTAPGPDGQLVGRLVDLVVPAHEVVHVRVAPEDPLEVRELWHRVPRLRRVGDRWQRIETLDVWRLDVVEGQRIGSWRVHEPGKGGAGLGADVSAEFLVGSDGTAGPIAGPAFPCRDPSGGAVLPWVVARAEDTGEFWPSHWRRAMHAGSLQAIAHWTYVDWTAFFATGEAHVIVGANPDAFPTTTREADDGRPAPSRQTRTMRIHPGTIVALPNPEGTPISAIKIGPGANLPNLLAMATAYNTLTHVADGLNPSDATRQHANPTSGAALEISAKSRREFADAIRPLAHAADQDAIRIATYLLASHGAKGLPEPAAYVIRYHTIPLTPAEQAEIRDSIAWEVERGHLSQVDAHRRLHPAKSADQARADLVAVAVEDARLRVAIDEALAAAGLPARPKPPAPSDGPPEEDPPAEDDPADLAEDDVEDGPDGPNNATKGGE